MPSAAVSCDRLCLHPGTHPLRRNQRMTPMPRSISRLIVSLLIPFAMADSADLRADDTAPPQGEVIKYTFEQSKIFPGTVREYSIYVPKQYDPAKPACLYVNQDGVQFKAPAVFDELIHKGE